MGTETAAVRLNSPMLTPREENNEELMSKEKGLALGMNSLSITNRIVTLLVCSNPCCFLSRVISHLDLCREILSGG